MPSGVMGMAQGATPTPVKPNVMAAMVSWNRAVEDAKNTGAVLHAQQTGVSPCITSGHARKWRTRKVLISFQGTSACVLLQ